MFQNYQIKPNQYVPSFTNLVPSDQSSNNNSHQTSYLDNFNKGNLRAQDIFFGNLQQNNNLRLFDDASVSKKT